MTNTLEPNDVGAPVAKSKCPSVEATRNTLLAHYFYGFVPVPGEKNATCPFPCSSLQIRHPLPLISMLLGCAHTSLTQRLHFFRHGTAPHPMHNIEVEGRWGVHQSRSTSDRQGCVFFARDGSYARHICRYLKGHERTVHKKKKKQDEINRRRSGRRRNIIGEG